MPRFLTSLAASSSSARLNFRRPIHLADPVEPPNLGIHGTGGGSLDPIATRSIEEPMLELETEYSVAIMTHDMQHARRVADTTAFFSVDISHGGRNGFLVEVGRTKALFDHPQQQLTRDYGRGEFS